MKKLCALFLCLACVAPFAACSQPVEDTETNLIIEMYEGGYGTEGMKAIADRFEEIYAEEGYTVSITSNSQLVMNGAYQQLQLGTDSATDLYFVAGVEIPYIIGEGKYFVKNTDNDYALEDITDLLEEKVYGEDITLGKKMFPSSVEFNTQTNGRVYSLNWAYGVTGFAYRRENFTEGGGEWQLPRTTKELEELIPVIKEAEMYPFVFCGSKASYFDYAALAWWRQFATDEEADNFWNCLAENEEGELEESADAFRSYARLQAYLNVDMCIYDNTNTHPDSMIFNNEEAQMALWDDSNTTVFMPTGDFAENEMNKLGITGDVGMMRIPVSSDVLYYSTGTYPNVQLHERFETIKDEQTLREVISVIDANGECPADIDPNDFAELKKIRSFTTTEGVSHVGYIPSCANAKEVAKKFFLFMASDEANQLYYDACGCFLPFQTENLDLGDDVTPFRQDILKMMDNVTFVSRFDSKNPLFYKTDLDFNLTEYYMDGVIGTTPESGDKMTGLEWFTKNADDVAENFSLYQSIVAAG